MAAVNHQESAMLQKGIHLKCNAAANVLDASQQEHKSHQST
jgi:hypothetical protein